MKDSLSRSVYVTTSSYVFIPAQEPSSKFRDISIIGIHPLKNHLFRISLNANAQRMQSACASIPLIDGMVVPLNILSF
ncbi:unnamed protein product, partial [Rotaria magnacalcarata]